MEEAEKIYHAALVKAGIKRFDFNYTAVKFLELCRRVLRDNPQNDFDTNVATAGFYLNMLLKFPNSEL